MKKILENRLLWLFVASHVFLNAVQLVAQTQKPQEPEIAGASSEAELALQTFMYPEGLQATLFAAEPKIANPVAIQMDYQGNMFVCESFRQENGVEDNRKHPEWLNDDLAAQSVGDRLAYMKKHLGEDLKKYSQHDDRIRLLQDLDGDGRADFSKIFAQHFNDPEMGTGAGVLSYRNKVYFTCIPDLYLLEDRDGDNVAEVRESLHTGFGVRFAFRGHDMHGLIVGPDRRLYFSVGDRGYNVSPEIHDPASGAVFRCELDGSNLEVIATGLRNPQELAFDDYGNLFTGDNNSDSGDKARWVYVVPGSDSGWRMYYQYLTDRGPFNREGIWHLYDPKSTPAYIVPPIDHIGDGPSGICFYPGTGLNDHFKDRFFFCDFRGSAAISGVRTFRNRPKGAFFEIADMEKTFWQILATDVGFGSNGRMYVSDWVFGWEGEGKGRIYSFHDPVTAEQKQIAQTEELLASKIETLPAQALVQLLAHRDRRVRQEAQFCLVDQKQIEKLISVSRTGKTLLTKLHAIWGIGILAREDSSNYLLPATELLIELANDNAVEMRAQAIKLIGELQIQSAREVVASRLSDSDPRVRYFSASALNRIGTEQELSSITDLLAKNADADPIVRHGCIMALTGIGKRFSGVASKLLKHESKSVRLAAVVAMRKNRMKEVASFLSDTDQQVVLEAARAIYDCPIVEAMPELSQKVGELGANSQDALVRRVLHANLRIGEKRNAELLAKLVANSNVDPARKIEAIEILSNWSKPSPIDGVVGDFRPPSGGDFEIASTAFAAVFQKIAEDEELVEAGIVAALKLNLNEATPTLKRIVFDEGVAPSVRAKALQALHRLDSESMPGLLNRLAKNIDNLSGVLLGAYCESLAELDSDAAEQAIRGVIENDNDDIEAKQLAVSAVSKLPEPQSGPMYASLLEAAMAGTLSPAIRLDVYETASMSESPLVQKQVQRYRRYLESSGLPGGKFHDSLVGGNSQRGRQIFVGKTEVSCVRCHAINDVGGEVGPALSEIGKERSRLQILESITEPNKVITDGFTQTVVLTDEGKQLSGIVKSRDENILKLLNSDGVVISVPIESIEDERQGESSMPSDLMNQLDPMELRDLVEFLVTQVAIEEPAKDFERPASHK